MAVLVIKGGEYNGHSFTLSEGECILGRGDKSQIVLTDSAVSLEHARVVFHDGQYHLQDLGSRNGLHVGRDRVMQVNLTETPRFRIGPYDIWFGLDEDHLRKSEEKSLEEIRRVIHGQLITALDLKQMRLEQMLDPSFRAKAGRELDKLLEAYRERIPKKIDTHEFKKSILDAALGLGPLEDLLADPSVTEIMVNAPDKIFIEKGGILQRSREQFINKGDIYTAIERIVGPIGRRIDESTPLVDARLSDGSRVNIIIPPLALGSPVVTIRKFPVRGIDMPKLVSYGSLSAQMAKFLESAVAHARNIVVSGGTGSGKTTLLNVLAGFISKEKRIVTIEDAAELQLPQENHVVRLETRPPNIEGKGEYTIRDLVKNALRMRPDRIVVGECRGGEALDMIQAMNTGHDGSLTTAHANSPADLIRRIETMVLMAGMGLPLAAVRENIASAIHLVVQINKFKGGKRRLTAISEIVEIYQGEIRLQNLFVFRRTGLDANQEPRGYFTPTGIIPRFVEELRDAGEEFDMSLFIPQPKPENHL